MIKKVGIIGASGWLGQHLSEALIQEGWVVIGYSRSSRDDGEVLWRQWDGEGEIDLTGLNAVINLAGESIDQRWSEEKKKAFRKSRVDLTESLSRAMQGSEVTVLLNASAVGYYGDRGEARLTESAEAGENYLARLCVDWEEAVSVPDLVRVCFLRTGVVLGEGGGAWAKMKVPFKLGIGGKLGSGRQWMPWIHLEDEIGAIVHCLEEEVHGPVNLVAPESVTNAAFTKEVGRAMSRPTFFAAPGFMLKLALGDFAEEGLLASQRVVPEVLEKTGFQFRFPDVGSAMKDLC